MVNTVDGFKRTTISLRQDDYEVLRFIAFKRKTSIAGLVKELIQEVLEDEEDIRDGLKAMEDKAHTMDWETFKRQYLGL
jgi:predicted DNA-binding ribbon-helix-helix protein